MKNPSWTKKAYKNTSVSQDGKGLEIEVDLNTRKKCKCGKDIWFVKTVKGKMIPIEEVGSMVCFHQCKFKNKL